MRALVLGGYGAVGAQVVAELRHDGHDVLTAGRDPARADRVLDLRVPDAALRPALSGVDVVVNAAGIEDAGLVSAVTTAGAAFVDITATTRYVAAVERLVPARPVLLSVGLAPGLTNLLAAAAHAADPPGPGGGSPVRIALLIGAGDRPGPAALDWAYDLLGRHFPDPAGRPVRNYTRPRAFDLPGHGRRRLYRVDYSDQHTLTRDLGVPVRTYFGLDSRPATALLAALTRVPGAGRLPRGPRLPGGDRWLALARTDGGAVRWAGGHGESRATAVVAAAATRAAVTLAPGVHHLHRVLTLADLPTGRGIELDR